MSTRRTRIEQWEDSWAEMIILDVEIINGDKYTTNVETGEFAFIPGIAHIRRTDGPEQVNPDGWEVYRFFEGVLRISGNGDILSSEKNYLPYPFVLVKSNLAGEVSFVPAITKSSDVT